MKKLKAAAYVLGKSLTSPQYYKDLLAVDFKFSLKYFVILAVIASLATLPRTVEPLINDFTNQANSFFQEILDYYPENLVVTISDEKLSINEPEPYFIPLPEALEDTNEVDSETVENLLVIDSKGTIDDLKTHSTLILVNEKNILVKESNKIEVFPLEGIPNTEITKPMVGELIDRVKPIVEVLPYIFIVLAFVASLFYYFGIRAIYLVFVATIFLVIGSIKKLNIPFKKYYQIGIHAMTMPLLIEILADLFQFPINIPFWFLAVNLLMGFMGLFFIAKEKQSPDNQ
jgi:hypothetical protein